VLLEGCCGCGNQVDGMVDALNGSSRFHHRSLRSSRRDIPDHVTVKHNSKALLQSDLSSLNESRRNFGDSIIPGAHLGRRLIFLSAAKELPAQPIAARLRFWSLNDINDSSPSNSPPAPLSPQSTHNGINATRSSTPGLCHCPPNYPPPQNRNLRLPILHKHRAQRHAGRQTALGLPPPHSKTLGRKGREHVR
jgi:hypothetical protein